MSVSIPIPADPPPRGAAAGMVKVAVATALWGLAHSLLASSWLKGQAAHRLGWMAGHALYRPLYLVIAVVLLFFLILYIRRQSGRDLYHLRGLAAGLLRLGQALALAGLVWTVVCVGLDHLSGWPGLSAWWQGGAVPTMPDGQEPSPGGPGSMRTDGPLGYTRHPLNWLLIPLFWLNPRMTTRLLAFNLVITAYLFVGSLHAEAHTRHTYGAAYESYRERVPYFLPTP
jgi:methanethiol S-methyltransferase